MENLYKERFELQKRIAQRVASSMEVNEILEKMRAEVRHIVSSAMEACILLLDPDAPKYTRPLQCALFDSPMNCLSCKRNRPAIQKAISKRRGIVDSKSEPVLRPDGSLVEVGPEMAMPVIADDEIVAVVSVVIEPGRRFSRKDYCLIRDLSESIGNVILSAKKHWEATQEKIRISRMLSNLSPFAPQSVRTMIEENREIFEVDKEKKQVTVLFLDLEGYTRLSASRSELEVREMIEKLFSSFVDPVHRSHGDIVETAGDGLMIVFKDDDPKTNATNAVKAALDIYERTRELSKELGCGPEPLRVNVGINSGAALVGMTRLEGLSGIRMTYTATGPVTNVAARLAACAEGGDILVGDETKKLIEGLWTIYDRGLAHLRGMDEPMKIYSLLKRNHE